MGSDTIDIKITNVEYLIIKKASKILRVGMGQAIYKYTFKDLEKIVQEHEGNIKS